MADNKKRITSMVTFAAVFISMCVLKLWITLFLIFGFAAVMTLARKNKHFCYGYCPLGTVMDMGDETKRKAQKQNNIKIIRKIWFGLFWIYIVVFVFFLYDKPFELWQQILLLMMFSLSVALVLQRKYGKRYWCINLCPLGSILDAAVKIRKRGGR